MPKHQRPSLKKTAPPVDRETSQCISEDSSSDSEASGGLFDPHNQDDGEEEIIPVEFEFYPLAKFDRSNVCSFLRPVFGDSVDLYSLAVTFADAEIGSAVRGESESSDLFAFSSLLALCDAQRSHGLKSNEATVTRLLLESSKSEALRALLSDPTRPCGLLLSERLLNVPLEIAISQLRLVQQELVETPNSHSGIVYLVFLCPVFRMSALAAAETPTAQQNQKRKYQPQAQQQRDEELFYVHPEEAQLEKYAEFSFNFHPPGIAEVNDNGEFRRGHVIQVRMLPALIKVIEETVQAGMLAG